MHRYATRLYPYLRPEQRIVLLPFAAYCEIGCTPNATLNLAAADEHTLQKATDHYTWAANDSRVVGLFLYRLKNLWQGSTLKGLDVCNNPWGTGLGLVDTCASGAYATPKTLAYYHQQGAAAVAGIAGARSSGSTVGVNACAADVFVNSNGGDDAADGCSFATAVATLARAQQLSRIRNAVSAPTDAAEAVNCSRSTGGAWSGATVWMAGTFYLTTGIKFTAADKCVRWTSAPAAAAVAEIHGGVALPPLAPSDASGDDAGWAPVTNPETLGRVKSLAARSKLLQLSLRSQQLNLTSAQIGVLTRRGFSVGGGATPLELFYNGTKLSRSRWPKAGAPPSSIARIQNSNKSSAMFTVNSSIPSHDWGASMQAVNGGVWLDGLLGQNWVWTYNRAEALANGSLTLAYPEVSDLELFSPTYCCHNRFFFDNVFEEISADGEYYVNVTEKIVYLIPPQAGGGDGNEEHRGGGATTREQGAHPQHGGASASRFEMMASVLTDPVFSFDSTASHMLFDNIAVSVSRGTAFHAVAAAAITIRNVEVSNVGLDAVVLGANSNVENSHLHHVGGVGVQVQAGSTSRLIPGNAHVRNCHIHHFAEVNQVYTPGVSLYGVGNTVEHCNIHDGPHCGMLLFGNDHVVSNNEIAFVGLEYVDMGAIYMNQGLVPFQRGSRIINNFIHHLGVEHGKDLVVGVYPDSSTMGLTVFGNVFYKAGTEASAAVMGNGFSYINTTNNIYVDCASPFLYSDWLKLSWGEALVPRYVAAWKQAFNATAEAGMLDIFYARYPELRTFWTEDRFAPKTNTFASSIIYNPTVKRKAGNESEFGFSCKGCDGLTDVQGTKTVWLAGQDPGFASVIGMNFTIADLGAVRAKIPEWVAIDFDAIGLLQGAPVGPAVAATAGGGSVGV